MARKSNRYLKGGSIKRKMNSRVSKRASKMRLKRNKSRKASRKMKYSRRKQRGGTEVTYPFDVEYREIDSETITITLKIKPNQLLTQDLGLLVYTREKEGYVTSFFLTQNLIKKINNILKSKSKSESESPPQIPVNYGIENMHPSDDERDRKRTNFTLVSLGNYEELSLDTPETNRGAESQIISIRENKKDNGFSISFSYKNSNEKKIPL